MLEIIHAMAPGAHAFFCHGEGGEAQFAQNILNLQAAGCDIIVDDLSYFDESPFQDGIVARAVNSVTAAGALYFSARPIRGISTAAIPALGKGISSMAVLRYPR